MKVGAIVLVGLAAALLAGGTSHAAERDERHAFAVTPGCTLKIDSHRGAIFINESDEPEIRVLVHLEIGADTEAEADRLRADLQLNVSSAGNVVTVHARNPAESRALWVWREEKQIDLTYRISVPRQCNAEIAVRNGSVTIGNLDGHVAVRVGNGTISCRHITGSLDAVVQEKGDVVVARCLGPLTARVQEGTIRTGPIAGRADLKTSAGDVDVLLAKAAIVASAEAGDVSVAFPRELGGEANLTARGGNVIVRLDPAANARVVASSVWGEVKSRLPLTIESGGNGRSRLTGRLREGGPLVLVRANGGHVRLEPGEPPFE
jgi:hypothetical protein